MAARFTIVLVSILGFAAPGLVSRTFAADVPPAAIPAAPGALATQGQSSSKPASATPAPAGKPAVVAVDRTAEVIILCYHRFVDKVRFPGTEIRPADFEAQMNLLKDSGITVIAMQDFLAWKRGAKSIPQRCAVITFDDGWETQYTIGWPILKKLGYPLTLFLYTEGVRGGMLAGGGSITWEQLADMRDNGVDIEAHSATHQDLREGHAVTVTAPGAKRIRKRLAGAEYEEWLQNEVAGCKELLEKKLAIKVNCFAAPFGYCNERIKELARESGYEAIFTVYGQTLMFDSPADALGRYAIDAGKPKILENAVKMLAAPRVGAVAEVAAVKLVTQPADGEVVRASPARITANLTGLGEADPDTAEMRISGYGVVPLSYDPKTDSVSYQVAEPLRDGNHTVILSAKVDGKKVETRWSFRVGKGTPAAGRK